jgi:hypothetical protein
MKNRSRREFLESCFYLAAAGVGSAVVPGLTRCSPASDFEPPYVGLHRSGELARRGKKLWKIMQSCELCPRQCGADRLSGDRGFCQASSVLEIAAFHPHHGEERPLVGRGATGRSARADTGSPAPSRRWRA